MRYLLIFLLLIIASPSHAIIYDCQHYKDIYNCTLAKPLGSGIYAGYTAWFNPAEISAYGLNNAYAVVCDGTVTISSQVRYLADNIAVPTWNPDGTCSTGTWSDCPIFSSGTVLDSSGHLFDVSLRPDGSPIYDSISPHTFTGLDAPGATITVSTYFDNGNGTGQWLDVVVSDPTGDGHYVADSSPTSTPLSFTELVDPSMQSTTGSELTTSLSLYTDQTPMDDFNSIPYNKFSTSDLSDDGNGNTNLTNTTYTYNSDGTTTTNVTNTYNYVSGGTATTTKTTTTLLPSPPVNVDFSSLNSSLASNQLSMDAVKNSTDAVKNSTDAVKNSTDAVKTSVDSLTSDILTLNSTASTIANNTDTTNSIFNSVKTTIPANHDADLNTLDTSTTSDVDGISSAVSTNIDNTKNSTDLNNFIVPQTLTNTLTSVFPDAQPCTGLPISFELAGQSHVFTIQCVVFDRIKKILSWLFYCLTVFYIVNSLINAPPIKG